VLRQRSGRIIALTRPMNNSAAQKIFPNREPVGCCGQSGYVNAKVIPVSAVHCKLQNNPAERYRSDEAKRLASQVTG